MSTRRAAVFRLLLGMVLGASAWWAVNPALPLLPIPIRFLIVWSLFTVGPGLALATWLTRGLDPLTRLIIAAGAGSAMSPLLIDMLGRLGIVPAFPFVALACAGAGVAAWRSPAGERGAVTSRVDAVACLGLLALVAVLGVAVFSHRFTSGPEGVTLYGDYDSADMGYYAAEAAEATHTVPPTASYYSGHALNAAYYAHLVLAMVHRFGGVPLLSIYFHYAWPAFLAVGALTAFVLVRTLTGAGVACLSVALMLIGSDFSYLAAWWLPHEAVDWDYLLWPTNFFTATAQVIHFNTWAPSLPVFFTALYAMVRGLQRRLWAWSVFGAFLLAVLFEFKPFAYAVTLAALGAAAVLARQAWAVRLRLAGTAALAVLMTLPFLATVAAMDPADRRTRLIVDFFFLPQKMLIKIDMVGAFERAAAWLAPWPSWRHPIVVALATVVILAGGIGVRWVAAPGVWRAVRPTGESADAPSWRLLGWVVVAATLIPFVVRTEPYVDTIQFYQAGLFVLWVFTAKAFVGFARARGRLGTALVTVAIALTLPSSFHYLEWKWTEDTREARASLSAAELKIANYLRTRDPERTVILHDRPLQPSLMTIMAERRIVLGWDVRYSAVGGEARLADVDAFFRSERGDPEAAMATLRRYAVTHLIVRRGDRVHPAVLERLRLLMQYPDVALFEVTP